jgi:peptide/nickel transport system permease protein
MIGSLPADLGLVLGGVCTGVLLGMAGGLVVALRPGTVRARALEVRVMRCHALPLAVAPVAALTGANMAMLVTNIVLVESAFNIPGIYREIRSVYSFADLPMIQGMVIETTVVIVAANTLTELIQARIDPRLR